jgi:heme/copper-type cytochrome/quinol oxidase subunit 3
MNRRAQLGMAMFLISEAVFFFLLILAFAYFRALPDLHSTAGWLLTASLVAASLAAWRAWRWVTVALGVAFLMGLFWTTSSVLTGLHGLHILAGIVALALVPASALRTMALYWYFFTAVWLAIVLSVYLQGVA